MALSMDQKQVLANAKRLRAKFHGSLMPNLLKAVEAEGREIQSQISTFKPSSSLKMSKRNPLQEPAVSPPENVEQHSAQLTLLVQPEIGRLLDELVYMNAAADRQSAAEVIFQMGIKMSRETIRAHFDLRTQLQEISDRFKVSLCDDKRMDTSPNRSDPHEHAQCPEYQA
ncbi:MULTISPECIES: hypothetical protein [unclassified Paenibacillus]|uniref:hypothetical protein n=1 Tax=unclassified Paenibacillus TaxID=185978 RepID=UPI0003FE50BE|nr:MULTISPECIES: hypothetical protein [unclassified Paenibacillus]KKC47413.1 hypothetical protein VE23_10040 [Paenibacillus sp. D9]CDN41937.1 hypothetical protein BN871_AQ_00080 [Paenibacillus sp. P22]